MAPFTLPGLDRTYPAGTYVVRTDEESLELSFAAFRRIATQSCWSQARLLRPGPSTRRTLRPPSSQMHQEGANAATRERTRPTTEWALPWPVRWGWLWRAV